MDTTILVAKVLGVYLVVSGLFLVTKRRTFSGIIKDYFNHPAVLYLTGVLLVVLSSLYLIQYNIWDGGFATIITFVMWLVIAKGILVIFVPSTFSKMNIEKWRGFFGFYGVLIIVAGVYLFFI